MEHIPINLISILFVLWIKARFLANLSFRIFCQYILRYIRCIDDSVFMKDDSVNRVTLVNLFKNYVIRLKEIIMLL